jgi:hypothetical protein
MTAPDGDLTAALLQLSEHNARLGSLDEREAGHYQQIDKALTDLHVKVTAMRGLVRGHTETLAALDGLDKTVADLAEQLASLLPPAAGPGYQPIPAVRWWDLSDGDRAKAIARIRLWVNGILTPYYGHLVAGLGDCWESHPLCLVQLDWLSELWSVCYLKPSRSARDLSGQAEFGTRILPAAAVHLVGETKGCKQHGTAASGRPTARTARP